MSRSTFILPACVALAGAGVLSACKPLSGDGRSNPAASPTASPWLGLPPPTGPGPVADPPGFAAATPAAAADAMASAPKEIVDLFAGRCATCHGAKGLGDGPAGLALTPKPRNFSDAEWQKATSDDVITKVLQGGGTAVGKSPVMPPAPDIVANPAQLKGVIALIRAMGGAAPAAAAAPAPGAAPAVPQAILDMYAARCAMCHGAKGLGDGVAGVALNPKPRNFSDVAWQKATTDDVIAKVLTGGGGAIGKSAAMPPAPDIAANPEQLKGITALIRSMAR